MAPTRFCSGGKQDLRFDISFTDALLLMPRFALTIKNLLMNKEKLFELAKIPLKENCSAMLLKKLLEKFGDPDKFLIPCDFPGMDVCYALARSVIGAQSRRIYQIVTHSGLEALSISIREYH
ncbi:hypothetical protein Tco_1294529 [Tanacetum coccineum]